MDRHQAIAAYDRFVNGQTGNGESPLNDLNPNDLRILGSDKFAARFLGHHWQPRSNKTFDQLVDEACQQFDVAPEALASHSRHRHLTYVRAWVAHQALILRIANLAQTARTFNRNESSLREDYR